MESSSKRRKIDHGANGLHHSELIDFESRNSSRVSTASTFVLQTTELLKEAKLDYSKTFGDVNAQLHRLKGAIDSINPHGPISITEATNKFEKQHRIIVPYPDPKPPKDAPYKVSFEPPAQCNVVGSYVSQTMIKSQRQMSVDMVVQMPKSLFQDKDYLNMRYFYRRAYYIAYVAAHVRKELGDSMDLNFECLHENPLLPVLVLRPHSETGDTADNSSMKGFSKTAYTIKLIPCAPDDLFPFSRVTPTSNNNRVSEASDKDNKGATPFYNSTLNAERTFIQYLRLLAHASKECPAFTESCILGRIWLQQRGFSSAMSQGGFGHFEWAVMIALLLQTGGRNGQAALSNSLSGTELFKAALQFLTTTDLSKKPFAFGSSKVDSDVIREAGPVMFDPIRELNILFKMSPWSATTLQNYAKSTTELLADEAAEKFDATFIVKVDLPLQEMDVVFELKPLDSSGFADKADRRGVMWNMALDAYKVLKKAYGKRSQSVTFHLPKQDPWLMSKSRSQTLSGVLIGVVCDPTHMSRAMEHGPPAEEQKEAAKFRQFWGEKSELRRFKDGSILECVEWSSKLPVQICEEMTRYVLNRHLKVTRECISTVTADFSPLVGLTHLDKTSFDAARQSFQSFEREIRNLEDMPLHIRQLSPISPSARYASIQPPLVGFHQGSIEPMEVNLYFEASSKWPENLTAIQEAKVEFLLDIDRRLTKTNEKITTYLGRENRDLGTENLAYLDILYDTGAAFRLRIHCDLEETLLGRQVKNKTLEPRVREEAVESFAKFNWLYNTLPLHTQTISTFCTRLHPLSQTIRLVKHWFNSHKLTGHIREELIEIFALHAFLQPYPWRQPTSVSTGFLRTLFFISKWDWREEALIVDTAENFTDTERTAIRQELQSWRKRDPNMNQTTLIVATSHDQSGLAYTREGPSKLVASRMTRLAKAACKLVRDKGVHLAPSDLFEPALQDYDVLFHLSTKAVKSIIRDAATDSRAKRHSQYKNLDDRTGKMPLPTRAHPTDVLAGELGRAYADTLIFFRGAAADDAVLAAIWNPKLQRHKFRAGLSYNFRAVSTDVDEEDEGDEGGDYVELNRKAVLAEIARVGGDLIRKIEVLDETE